MRMPGWVLRAAIYMMAILWAVDLFFPEPDLNS